MHPYTVAEFVGGCNGRKGLNLRGALLNDGANFILDTAEECCAACKDNPECNVWVYCEGDCVKYAYHSCWLKKSTGGSAVGRCKQA